MDPHRWERVKASPLRLLREVSAARLAEVAADRDIVRRVEALVAAVDADLARPSGPGPGDPEHPVAFLCAEFGVHGSLPIYSGGLGVLAGDIVKEASDLALPMVGVGLLYRTGYFHQRIDTSGMQHEYWIESDPAALACVPVTEEITGVDLIQLQIRLAAGEVMPMASKPRAVASRRRRASSAVTGRRR